MNLKLLLGGLPLTAVSFTGMYGCSAVPGGDGKTTSQSHGRFGPSRVHGTGIQILRSMLVAKESL